MEATTTKTSADPNNQPPSGQWTIRCTICGRVTVVETKDVRAYLDDGFPICCGKVISLTIEPIEPPTIKPP